MISNNQELGRGEAPPDGEAIDFDFLRQQTFDDVDLTREVLGLFAGQVRALVPSLPERSDREQQELAHRLVGSARGIGARAAAKAAEAYGAAALDARPSLYEVVQAEFARAVACAEERLRRGSGSAASVHPRPRSLKDGRI